MQLWSVWNHYIKKRVYFYIKKSYVQTNYYSMSL